MRNSKIVIALFAITLFALTSCQKENIENTHEAAQQTELLSGEELPTTAAVSKEEIQTIRKQQVESFKKEAQAGDLAFTEAGIRSLNSSSSRSRTITNISCGNTKNGTTRNETNTVSRYDGADKVYLLAMNNKQDIRIQSVSYTHLTLPTTPYV